MNEFEQALELTVSSLKKLSETGANLRGSRESLRRLAAAKRLAAAPVEEAAPGLPPVKSEVVMPERIASAPSPVSVAPKPVVKAAVKVAPVAPVQLSAEVFQTVGTTKAERLAEVRAAVAPCVKCPNLAATRTQTVFGVGNIDAEILFVGEAPGADEDLQGEPFVGLAGQLLDKIIVAMGVRREDVFIANVLKCRPDMPPGSTGNRRPAQAEMQTCLPYLRAQIDIIQPKVLVALGAVAMEGLLGSVAPMSRLRGQWHEFHGMPLMATYHPAYLLRNQSLSEKRKVWEDMLMVMERVGLPISNKQRGFFLK